MSSPRKPITGQAPAMKNTTPPTKLIPAISPMTTKKPVPLSERCGVSSAENSGGSAASTAPRAISALLSLMQSLYRLHGAQDDPQADKENGQKARQAEGR